MREYDPALLGFVVMVNQTHLPKIKDEIVKAVHQMESDERAYIYRPGSKHIARWPGEAVGQIANYQHSAKFPLRISDPISHTVYLMSEEDEDATRHIFVIFDQVVPYMNYELKRGMKIDQQIDFAGEGNCNFYLIDLGTDICLQEACDSHPRCKHIKLLPNGLGDFILNTYKNNIFNVGYDRINLEQLSGDYKMLKEKNGDSTHESSHEGGSILDI